MRIFFIIFVQLEQDLCYEKKDCNYFSALTFIQFEYVPNEFEIIHKQIKKILSLSPNSCVMTVRSF